MFLLQLLAATQTINVSRSCFIVSASAILNSSSERILYTSTCISSVSFSNWKAFPFSILSLSFLAFFGCTFFSFSNFSFSEVLLKFLNSTKQLWTNLNSLCSLKPKGKKTDITKLCINGKEITNKVDIRNALNTYFCNIGQDLVIKLQQNNNNKKSCNTNWLAASVDDRLLFW